MNRGLVVLGSLLVLVVSSAAADSPPANGAPPGFGMAGITAADLGALRLSEEQQAKLTEIQRDFQRKQWNLMGSIRETRWKQQDAMKAAELDVAAAQRNFEAIAKARREMFDAAVDARKRIEAVLTKEQLEALRQRRAASPPPAGASPRQQKPQ